MKFLLLIYTDDTLLEALPAGAFDQMMHGCITHADELKTQGTLLESQQLEHGSTARTVRVFATARHRSSMARSPRPRRSWAATT